MRDPPEASCIGLVRGNYFMSDTMIDSDGQHDDRTLSVDLPRDPANPVLVEVTRGSMVESRHRGSVAVVDVTGKIALRWGDTATPVLPRSAIKAIQALPLVESGAADAFSISDAELAIACASHSGEPRHVATVRGWLERMGLGEDDLECGAHWPRHHRQTLHDMIRAGEEPGPAHNNCSGKHTGMLATAHHLGETLAGYVAPTHGVQQRILGTLEACAASTSAMRRAGPTAVRCRPGASRWPIWPWPSPVSARPTTACRRSGPRRRHGFARRSPRIPRWWRAPAATAP